MKITHMTYARVAQNAAPGDMVPRPMDAGVEAFLVEHVEALLSSSEKGIAPNARFVETASQTEFERLRNGNDQEFLAAAKVLTLRLIAQMDGRSSPGLLVCVRTAEAGIVSAAALKLQVVTPNAAVLEALDSGDEVLAAAKNVLDAPGELQKGALVDDPRPDSDVIIGDKLTHDAQYFPRAFGIKTDQRARDGGADLLNALTEHLPAPVVSKVARELPALPAGAPAEVLAAVSAKVPELTEAVREVVVTSVQNQTRPVTTVATDAAIKQVITAEGVTITGSVAAMETVTIDQLPNGHYRITIDVAQEPRTRFKP